MQFQSCLYTARYEIVVENTKPFSFKVLSERYLAKNSLYLNFTLKIKKVFRSFT